MESSTTFFGHFMYSIFGNASKATFLPGPSQMDSYEFLKSSDDITNTQVKISNRNPTKLS